MKQLIPNVSLVIKAKSPALAEAVARARGFEPCTIHAHQEDIANVTILAHGPIEKAQAWFGEPSIVTPGYGFPAGSLLLYREITPMEVRPSTKGRHNGQEGDRNDSADRP